MDYKAGGENIQFIGFNQDCGNLTEHLLFL